MNRDEQKWVVTCINVKGSQFKRKFNSTQDLDNFRRNVGVGFSARNSKNVKILKMEKVDEFPKASILDGIL